MRNHGRSKHKVSQKSQLSLATFGHNTPTSIVSERAFSATGLFITRIRSRLADDTLDSLCYLGNYFKNQKN